jgi:histone-lysine N-methyltransferase SETD3
MASNQYTSIIISFVFRQCFMIDLNINVHPSYMYCPGALTPFGDLHNYLPPPPPFTPDILKGLGHAKEALVPTKTAQTMPPSADTLGSHLVESLADEASAGPDQEGSRGSTHQVGSRSPAETCLMAATRPQEAEASDTSETAVDDREVGDGHFDEDSGVYRLVARRRYKKGEEVYLCYGRHTNLELLEHYGFLLLDNPHGMPSLIQATGVILYQSEG